MGSPTWDYQHAYKGAPMVAVRGFPRPLYPPDAAPRHRPSVDGPDVEAIKRTTSRLGRWNPWTAFDQTYSNAFAHGRGPNVADTGVAGFQRQMNIQPTGFVGETTFNAYRSALIPSGLPHAGEHGMDARAVELINAAWDMFQGEEPTPPTSSSSAQARLARAQSQLGVCEDPPNSNHTPYGEWYGMDYVPWCAIFCTWADQTGDEPSGSFRRGSAYSYVPYVVSDARLGKNGLCCTSDPQPGDLVCFDWDDGEYDHIGIVESGPDESGDFRTVEGNTSLDDNSNGGQVMRRTRNIYAQGTVFVRVAE
jgi:hypothetical protein